jgi:gliding motility-associated-like protein
MISNSLGLIVLKLSAISLCLFFIIDPSHAQLCQGSLGDPIININFGNGVNPGGPLSAVTTSYQYTSTDCPGDGFYTVRNNTNNCFNNTWHSLNADHTGDANGYFMLVNASYQPGAFYLDTVRGLCGNTTYEFAAWVMNMLLPSACNSSGIQPNITFSIEKTDGTILQTFNTNNIPSSSTPSWKQYGLFFKTPPSVSDIVLRIVNNAPGGCGNDIALDDITFRPCGPQVSGTIDGQPVTSFDFCEGIQRSFSVTCIVSGGFNNPVFQWQSKNSATNVWTDIPFANTNLYNITFPKNISPGVYQVRLAIAESGNMNSLQCRIYSQPFSFTVNGNPVTSLTNNSPICEGSVLLLSATGGVQYQWSGPAGFTFQGSQLSINNVQLNQSGKYYVTVTNAAGCINKDSANVIINPAPYATTSFSNANICAGDSIQLIAAGGNSYQWIPSTGLSNINIADPMSSPFKTVTYNVIVSNQFNCKDTASINIIVNPRPRANAGPDKLIFKGQSVELSGSVNGPGNYIWSPSTNINDVHSLHPIVHPLSNQAYVLTLNSNVGCGSSSDTTLVKVFNGIFIPNAFSPNGDGVNDTWEIAGLGACPSFEVSVYSRWGELVFYTKDKVKGWNGTFKGNLLPNGVYPYTVKACFTKEVMTGFVVLLR